MVHESVELEINVARLGFNCYEVYFSHTRTQLHPFTLTPVYTCTFSHVRLNRYTVIYLLS